MDLRGESASHEPQASAGAGGFGRPFYWRFLGERGPTPSPRCGHTMTRLPDNAGVHAVVFGGDSGKAPGRRRHYYNNVTIWDHSNKKWIVPRSVQGTVLDERSHHTATVMGQNRLFVLGGSNSTGYSDIPVVMSWDNNNSDGPGYFDKIQWEHLSTMRGPLGRRGHTCTTIGGLQSSRMFIFGGSTQDEILNDLWELDTLAMKWLPKGAVKGQVPPPRAFHTAVAEDNGVLVVFGGVVSTNKTDDSRNLYFFDPRTNSWGSKLIPEGWPPRYGHTTTILDDKLIIIGGLDASRRDVAVSQVPYCASINFGSAGTGNLGSTQSRIRWEPVHVDGVTDGSGNVRQDLDPEGRVYHTACLMDDNIDSGILVFGGYKPESQSSSNSMWLLTEKAKPILRLSVAAPSPIATPSKEIGTPIYLDAGNVGPIKIRSKVVVATRNEGGEEMMRIVHGTDLGNCNRRVEKLESALLGAVSLKTVPPSNDIKSIAERFVDDLLHPFDWEIPTNRKFPFSAYDICVLCDHARMIMEGEGNLLRVSAPIKLYGDIHGQFSDLMALFKLFGSPAVTQINGDIGGYRYLFLGDFVDRGTHGLEVICLLLALKVMYPQRCYLIRGNHESPEINCEYGFLAECLERMGDMDGMLIWKKFNEAFCWMPPACLINGSILAMHGGIGKSVNSLADIEGVPRGTAAPDGGPVLNDLLWSDPTIHDQVVGIHSNNRGPGIVKFGPDRVHEFCRLTGVQMIVRAHECVTDGFEYFAGGRLVTIFSATNYCGRYNNNGCMMEVSASLEIQFKVIEPLYSSPVKVGTPSELWKLDPLRPPTPPRDHHARAKSAEEIESLMNGMKLREGSNDSGAATVPPASGPPYRRFEVDPIKFEAGMDGPIPMSF